MVMGDESKNDDKLPDAESDARFKRIVGNLLNTPRKPHKPQSAPDDGDATEAQRR
jgi:hypothetical protein